MLNISQIGVGYWGPNLLRNLVANKSCHVSSIVDLSKERRDYVRALYPSIMVTDDASQVFQNPAINAVVIATPVAAHFELAMKALGEGKHILVEKPMARTVAEVEQIGNLAEKKEL